MKQVQRQAVLGLHVDSLYLFALSDLAYDISPCALKTAAASLHFTSSFQVGQRGVGSWLLPTDSSILLRITNVLKVPRGRLLLIPHWLELGHMTTTSYKGA